MAGGGFLWPAATRTTQARLSLPGHPKDGTVARHTRVVATGTQGQDRSLTLQEEGKHLKCDGHGHSRSTAATTELILRQAQDDGILKVRFYSSFSNFWERLLFLASHHGGTILR